MKNKICQTFDEAVADIADGSTIMFAGFGGVGAPQNLMAALLSTGAAGITGISNEHGGIDGRIVVLDILFTAQHEQGDAARMLTRPLLDADPPRVIDRGNHTVAYLVVQVGEVLVQVEAGERPVAD